MATSICVLGKEKSCSIITLTVYDSVTHSATDQSNDQSNAAQLSDSQSEDDEVSVCNSTDSVLSEEIGNSAAVTQWYNQLPDRGTEFRKKSPIFHLRNFNNWIKSILIGTYLGKCGSNPTVLDLCCGKGGDLLKWKKGKVGYLIMADIAETSIGQARARLKDNTTNIQAEFHCADCTRVYLHDFYKSKLGDAIDLTSCQFSFHYCFESEAQALMMIQNACEYLRPGGFFIGTIPNAYELVKRVQHSDSLSFANRVYGVTFETEPDEQGRYPLFGTKYHFHLEGVVDVPEYLVYFPLLEKILWDKYRMKCVLCQSFYDFFERNKSQYSRLLYNMQALQTKKFEDGRTYGTISADEWEAIGRLVALYVSKK
jgi:mRNA (guanine-N7-)-methyltransferase